MKCSIDECDKPVVCRGYCALHYGRVKVHGNPYTVQNLWPKGRIEKEIFKCMKILGIERMPTGPELMSLQRTDLHCKISKTKKYGGWAKKLNLQRKSSHTLTGQDNENLVENMLIEKGYEVENMSTKHPYDLLVDGAVKIDVKVANPFLLRGSRVHTFGIVKNNPTCDIYICLAFDEQKKIERVLVIPSHLCRVKTLCIGKESKYNKFHEQWNYIKEYSEFLKGVV
jgi:hypothetical protein